jgi:hypothetical protein
MKSKNDNLIFLISQPRAGSTLTQKMLGSHSMIHTQSEPWVMLHPLHALKPEGLITDYNAHLHTNGLRDFISSLPGGEAHYIEQVAATYAGFYNAICEAHGKKCFLDKTPRYYLIIPELVKYFPEAKFLFLWRNPLAVLNSIINTWTQADWYRLSDYKSDLYLAPQLMNQARKLLGDKALQISYEELLANPAVQIELMCRYLEIPFEAEMIDYGNTGLSNWQYGDKGTVYEKGKPDAIHADLWHQSLNNPQHWRTLYDYLKMLGEKEYNAAGYDYHGSMDILQQYKPNLDIEKHSVALHQLTDNTARSMLEYKKALELVKQKDNLLKQKNEELKQKNEELKQKNEELKQKNEALKSASYRIGRIITWPMRKIL